MLQRQRHGKGGPFSRCALHRDAAAAKRQNPADKGESETVSRSCSGGVRLVELIKNMFGNFFVHADSLIGNHNLDKGSGLPERHPDHPALRAEFDGVPQEVDPDVAHHLLVGFNKNGGEIEIEQEPLFLQLTAPSTKFIAGFVGHANFFDGAVHRREGDRLVIRTDTGKEIRAGVPEADQPPVGKAATLIIRPENTAISSRQSEEANTFAGAVKARIYLGSNTRYLVDLGEDREVEIDLHTKDSENFNEGDSVYVTLDESNLVLVER